MTDTNAPWDPDGHIDQDISNAGATQSDIRAGSFAVPNYLFAGLSGDFASQTEEVFISTGSAVVLGGAITYDMRKDKEKEIRPRITVDGTQILPDDINPAEPTQAHESPVAVWYDKADTNIRQLQYRIPPMRASQSLDIGVYNHTSSTLNAEIGAGVYIA